MTVLNWAGKYEQAIKIYEDGQYGEAPDYVKMNIAGAYYRLNLLDKVADIIIPLLKMTIRKLLYCWHRRI